MFCTFHDRGVVSTSIDALVFFRRQLSNSNDMEFLSQPEPKKSNYRVIPEVIIGGHSLLLDIEHNSKDGQTKILQMKKNQPIQSQELFEKYCITSSTFAFNHAGYHKFFLIKSHSPFLGINEKGFKPINIRNAKQFVSFERSFVQFFENFVSFEAAAFLDSFLKSTGPS